MTVRVIYADVLVVINIYITYILLSATALLLHKRQSTAGKVIASVVSGFYSLIILIPQISDLSVGISRAVVSVLLIFIAFPKASKKEIFRTCVAFFAVNFIFAGFMFALWLFVAPEGMYFSNSIVYFDIDAGMLIFMTVLCYGVINLCHRFISHRVPVNTVYDCEIYVTDKAYKCHCFLDTGNSLKDCYTGNSVMIVSRHIFSSLIAENPMESELKMRMIPCSTVSDRGVLYAFSCDRVKIKSIDAEYNIKEVTVALTEGEIMNGRYEGILPCDIFENYANEREKSYV